MTSGWGTIWRMEFWFRVCGYASSAWIFACGRWDKAEEVEG